MKKLLSILSVGLFSSTVSTSVVACNQSSKTVLSESAFQQAVTKYAKLDNSKNDDINGVQNAILQFLGLNNKPDAVIGVNVTLSDHSNPKLTDQFQLDDQIDISVTIKNNPYISDSVKPLTTFFGLNKANLNVKSLDFELGEGVDLYNSIETQFANQVYLYGQSFAKLAGQTYKDEAVKLDPNLGIVIKDWEGNIVKQGTKALAHEAYTVYFSVNANDRYFYQLPAQSAKQVRVMPREVIVASDLKAALNAKKFKVGDTLQSVYNSFIQYLVSLGKVDQQDIMKYDFATNYLTSHTPVIPKLAGIVPFLYVLHKGGSRGVLEKLSYIFKPGDSIYLNIELHKDDIHFIPNGKPTPSSVYANYYTIPTGWIYLNK